MRSSLLQRCIFAAALGVLPGAAYAGALTVITVKAPDVNCVFDASCKITVNDTTGGLTYTPLGSNAYLQSRVFSAKPGTPAAGHTGYLYRVNLSHGENYTECLAGLVLNTGPVAKLPYAPNQQAHIFVITQGGIGTVSIRSAEQDGDVVTFAFDKFLCHGSSSFFFGFAAAKGPVNTVATLFGPGSPPFVQTAARTPQH
jgi:hypothetical protein